MLKYIFNNVGEILIFLIASMTTLNQRTAFSALGDGQVGGNFVPNGTYAVVVKFTSRDQNPNRIDHQGDYNYSIVCLSLNFTSQDAGLQYS